MSSKKSRKKPPLPPSKRSQLRGRSLSNSLLPSVETTSQLRTGSDFNHRPARMLSDSRDRSARLNNRALVSTSSDGQRATSLAKSGEVASVSASLRSPFSEAPTKQGTFERDSNPVLPNRTAACTGMQPFHFWLGACPRILPEIGEVGLAAGVRFPPIIRP